MSYTFGQKLTKEQRQQREEIVYMEGEKQGTFTLASIWEAVGKERYEAGEIGWSSKSVADLVQKMADEGIFHIEEYGRFGKHYVYSVK